MANDNYKLDVCGKGAIVTGGGSGINLAFVKVLFNSGCSVVIMDIALHSTASEWLATLTSEEGPKIHFYQADVSDWKELEAVFEVYDKVIGGVPYLVCPGAGIYEPSTNGFWADKDVDGHYRLLDINMIAPIKMSRIAIRKMLEANKPGIILHVSSTGAQKAHIMVPLYQAGKAAISTFVRGMASLKEMGGIRVVAVAPGIIKSPLFTDNPKALRFIDPEKDVMLTPEAVARAMMAVATDTRYPPGTVLECADLNDNWRVVNLLNDPGPQGAAIKSSNKDSALADIQETINAERGHT